MTIFVSSPLENRELGVRRKLQRGDIAEVVREDNAILGWLDKLQVTVWVQQEDGLWDVVSLVNGT